MLRKRAKTVPGGVFLWEPSCSGAAFIVNTMMGVGIYLFTNSEAASSLTTVPGCPGWWKSSKRMAVLFIFLLFRMSSTRSWTASCSFHAAWICRTRTYYIYNYGYLENEFLGLLWLTFVRVVLVAGSTPFTQRSLALDWLSPALRMSGYGWSRRNRVVDRCNLAPSTYTGRLLKERESAAGRSGIGQAGFLCCYSSCGRCRGRKKGLRPICEKK